MADTIDNLLAANRSSGVLNAIANPPQVNPLAAMNSAAEAVRSRYGVQQMSAALAAGRAYQAATDPNTGNVDTLQANKILAADPAGTLAMQTTATSGQTLQQAQQTRDLQAQQAVNVGIASVLSLPMERQTRDTYTQLLNSLPVTQQDKAAAVQDMPQSDDPAAWRQYGMRHLFGNLSGPDQATRVLPQGGSATMPQGVVPYTQSPAVGAYAGGGIQAQPGGVAAGTSPEFRQMPVPGPVDANNRPTVITREQSINLATGGGVPGGGGQVQTPAGLPPSLRNPARAGDAPGAAPPAVPGVQRGSGGVGYVSGPSPQQASANEATGKANADYFQGVANQGTQAQQQGAVLSTMLSEAARFPTGPVRYNDGKAFIQKYAAPLAAAVGIKPEIIATGESIDKMAAGIADAQAAGSDARLAVIQKANPSSANTPEGLSLILRQLQGNADYLGVRAQMAREWGDKSDRDGFEKQGAGQLNPQVFQYNRLTPEQKTPFFDNLTKKDKAQFKSDYLWAQSRGWVGNGNQ